MAFNIVEAIQESDSDCAFDQPCKFGHRVEGHAVYCHNDAWVDGPRKCHRSWSTGGEVKDEDCPGFQPNEAFRGSLDPTPIIAPFCTKCDGFKVIKPDRETIETCSRCMGDGSEPHSIEMTQWEQDTLELGHLHGGKQLDWFARIAETDIESKMICRLVDLRLLDLRTISAPKNYTVYLVRLTGKGDAVMRANWNARKHREQEKT